MGETATLKVRGSRNIAVYRARIKEPGAKRTTLSKARRHFCAKCASALWAWDPRWEDWVYPFASAIDTPLPKPPEDVLIMLDYAVPWADIPSGREHKHFDEYPNESIADWHRKRLLEVP
jgi:hypothetical protein